MRARISVVTALLTSLCAVPSTSAAAQSPLRRPSISPAAESPPAVAPQFRRPTAPPSSIDDALTVADAATNENWRVAGTPAARNTTAETVVEVFGTNVSAAIIKAGGTVLRADADITLARLSATGVARVSAAVGVTLVRNAAPLDVGAENAPMKPVPQRGASGYWPENYSRNGAAGIKIGMIDSFDSVLLSRSINSADIGPVPAARRRCWNNGATCAFGTDGAGHGIAVAEVISDVAPNVILYLAEARTLSDYRLAIDWFASQGVQVLNHARTGAFDGPGNGTGPSAAVVDYAVTKGILWVNSGGNAGSDPNYTTFAGGYWRGTWADPDNDRWLNFRGTDESLSAYCGFLAGVRWDDWTGTKTDYDLYISDYRASTRTNGTRVAASLNNQATGALPLEGNDMRGLCNRNTAFGPVYDTNGDGYVSLWVQRNDRSAATSAAGDILEIRAHNGYLEYSTSVGSASGPFADSKNLGLISVGAAESGNPWWYSSQGPTNDGRVKPDLVAPGCMSTTVYGQNIDNCSTTGFGGTSASAAIISGIAAHYAMVYSPSSPARLHLRLRGRTNSQATQQLGWGHPSSIYFLPNQSFKAGAFVPQTPTRLVDTRSASGPFGPRTPGHIPAGGTLRLNTQTRNANAVVLNVTLVNARAPGYLQVFDYDITEPTATSSVNADAVGQTVSNLVIVRPDVQGSLDIFTSGGADIVVDKLGEFREATGGRFHSIEPVTVFDSKSCVGLAAACVGERLPAPHRRTISVRAALGDVPTSHVGSVLITLTATEPTRGGYASALVTGVPGVPTSTINVDVGRPATGTTLVPVSASGTIDLAHSMEAHFNVEVVGWFDSEASGNVEELGLFLPTLTARIADTRRSIGGPSLAPNTVVDVRLSGSGIPLDGTAEVLANVTVAGALTPGTVSVASPTGGAKHRAIEIGTRTKVAAGTTVSGASQLGFTVTAAGSAHVVVDALGWFIGPRTMLGGRKTLSEAGLSLPVGRTIGAPFVSIDARVVASTVAAEWNELLYETHVWDRSSQTLKKVPSLGRTTVKAMSSDGNRLIMSDGSPITLHHWRTGETMEVSVDSSGRSTRAEFESASADLRYVVFSTADRAVPEDTDSLPDYYVRDTVLGTTRLAPFSSGGRHAYQRVRLTPSGSHFMFEYHDSSNRVVVERVSFDGRQRASHRPVGLVGVLDVSSTGRFILGGMGHFAVFRYDLGDGLAPPARANNQLPTSWHATGLISQDGTFAITSSSAADPINPWAASSLFTYTFETGHLKNELQPRANREIPQPGQFALSGDGRFAIFFDPHPDTPDGQRASRLDVVVLEVRTPN